jgi:hypothetical protein
LPRVESFERGWKVKFDSFPQFLKQPSEIISIGEGMAFLECGSNEVTNETKTPSRQEMIET